MSEPNRRLSAEEYLALEQQSEEKHEFLDGEMFAMGGASRRHNLIALQTAAALLAQLRGRSCEVYMGDMRIHVDATGLYTYPDVVVVCGKPQLIDAADAAHTGVDTLLNPTSIVEVLSPSTEGYDRGKKFVHYRTIESLAEVVFISQERVEVERFSRQPDGDWLLHTADRVEDRLALPAIGCEVSLAAIYERVFPAES